MAKTTLTVQITSDQILTWARHTVAEALREARELRTVLEDVRMACQGSRRKATLMIAEHEGRLEALRDALEAIFEPGEGAET